MDLRPVWSSHLQGFLSREVGRSKGAISTSEKRARARASCPTWMVGVGYNKTMIIYGYRCFIYTYIYIIIYIYVYIYISLWLVVGFNPSEKYSIVSWDDDIPNIFQTTKQL